MCLCRCHPLFLTGHHWPVENRHYDGAPQLRLFRSEKRRERLLVTRAHWAEGPSCDARQGTPKEDNKHVSTQVQLQEGRH